MAGKDSTTAIIVIVIMMVTILAIGSGWYILSGNDDDKKDKKKGDECPGPDVNAVYEYDDDENCVWVSGGGGGGSNQANQDNNNEALYENSDCVIDGYTFQGCELKTNGICGVDGDGTQLRVPNKIADAIGSGSCEAADYVDCVVPCPETCQVTDSCCDETYVGSWVKTDGYKGCVADGSTLKRKYTRQGNGDLCSDSNERYENDDTCNYIEGLKKLLQWRAAAD